MRCCRDGTINPGPDDELQPLRLGRRRRNLGRTSIIGGRSRTASSPVIPRVLIAPLAAAATTFGWARASLETRHGKSRGVVVAGRRGTDASLDRR